MGNIDDDVICIPDSDDDADVCVSSVPVNATKETASENNRTALNSSLSTESSEERAARKKKEKIEMLEKQLKKMEKEIEKYDLLDVDLDDKRNSAYLVKSRMEYALTKHFKTLCKETEYPYYTGRPIARRLKLTNITRFPEINEAVEKFMNSKSVLYAPDFKTIYDIVANINDNSRPPLLCIKEPDEVHSTAHCLFKDVMKILRGRRGRDMQISVPLWETNDDPADQDPELERKLKESKRLGKSESQVFESFVRREEEQIVAAMEVMDDSLDEISDESDNGDEEDDLAATEKKKELKYTREQVDDEDEEDDAEQCEPSSKRLRGNE